MSLRALVPALSTAPLLAAPAAAQGIGPNDTVPEIAEVPLEAAGEVSPWTGSVQVGGNSSSGNSETSALSVLLNAEKRSGAHRYAGKASYNFNEDREEGVSEDNRSLTLEYNRFVDEDLYLLGNASYLADEVEGLDARVFAGVGAGVQLHEDEGLHWNAEAGVAQVDEDYANDAADAGYTAVRSATGLAWRLTEKLRWSQDVEVLNSFRSSDDVLVVSDTRFDLRLRKGLVASVRYVLDYDNTPAVDAQRTDHRVSLTFGWTF